MRDMKSLSRPLPDPAGWFWFLPFFCLLQFQVKQPHNVEGGLVFLDSNRTKISNSNDSREGLVVEQMGLKKHQKEIYSNEPRLWIYVSALFLGITILGVDLIILLKQ